MSDDRRRIFVFGSNISGKHGKGAALYAKTNYGAINGKGWGLQGDSFAIPTKSYGDTPLPSKSIGVYLKEFIKFAQSSPDLFFDIGGLDVEYQMMLVALGFMNEP